MKMLFKKIGTALIGAAVISSFGFLGCAKKTASGNDKEILVVSFGTSYNNSRTITIGGIESAIREAFPEWKVERAFTADTIIGILKDRDGIVIDTVQQALDKALAAGVKTIVIQPTHLMSGFEFTDLNTVAQQYKGKFDSLVVSAPLLTSDSDYEKVSAAITKKTASFDDGKTAICFMGHGTEADSNSDYAKMQTVLTNGGFKNYYVGTVEATPSVDDLIAAVKANPSYKHVVLVPFMVVAGDHANNDMAGDEDDSWKTKFLGENYEVTPVLEGLGQNWDVQQIYVQHVKDAMATLSK
ncbi:MAG: sirohydrochlorin cobaltochelatase [Treponema sp.]|nr:sirohydrochlorin cobaltochelatase [Treponema sp.]